jgi:hypothetical protein
MHMRDLSHLRLAGGWRGRDPFGAVAFGAHRPGYARAPFGPHLGAYSYYGTPYGQVLYDGLGNPVGGFPLLAMLPALIGKAAAALPAIAGKAGALASLIPKVAGAAQSVLPMLTGGAAAAPLARPAAPPLAPAPMLAPIALPAPRMPPAVTVREEVSIVPTRMQTPAGQTIVVPMRVRRRRRVRRPRIRRARPRRIAERLSPEPAMAPLPRIAAPVAPPVAASTPPPPPAPAEPAPLQGWFGRSYWGGY